MGDGVDRPADAALPADAIDPGTSVLVAGPAMTGKRGLVYRLLCDAADGLAGFVTTKLDAGAIEAELSDHWTLGDWQLRFVECGLRRRRPDGEDERVQAIANAGDLTGIGIALSGIMQDAYHDPTVDHAAVGFHSLSTLLMYADLRRVYQFVHVVTGRIDSSSFVGAFSLDASGRDDESVTRLKGLVDGIVEVRDDEGGPELRVRGAVDGPRQWTAYSPR